MCLTGLPDARNSTLSPMETLYMQKFISLILLLAVAMLVLIGMQNA